MDGRRRRKSRRAVVIVAVVLTGLLGFGGTMAVQAGGGQAATAQAACSAPAWSPSATYNAGAKVSHNGHEWRANQWMWPGLEPGNSGAPPYWVPWADLGSCTTGTTTTQPPGSTTTTSPPGETVENHYSATGPWAVTTGTASVPGTPGVVLHYPTNLGAGGHRHPVTAWGNGAFGTCSGTADTQTHLASWGFVVVCPETGQIEPEHLAAAVRWVLDRNDNPSSVFHGKLDTADVASMGHSRGAGASVLAAGQEPALFTAIALVNYPDRWAHDDGGTGGTNALRQLTDTSVFLVAGTADGLVSEGEQRFFFDTAAGPAARAAVVDGGHNLIGVPDNAMQPYLTAWLAYTLEDDQLARRAFVGNPPEINADSGWAWQQEKNLP